MEDLLLQNAIRSKKKDFVRGRNVYEVGLSWRNDMQFYDKTHDYEKDMKVVEERKAYLFTSFGNEQLLGRGKENCNEDCATH